MKIVVGSLNPAKRRAVDEALRDYEKFRKAQIFYFGVDSGTTEQPLSWKDIIHGAINRARNAFEIDRYDYGVGLESGLVQIVPERGERFDFGVCSIYDGIRDYLGVSCGFRIPAEVQRIIEKENVDMSVACKIAGLTNSEKVGNEEGIIGILTGGRITRKDQAMQAIHMACLQLENLGMYS